MKALLMRIAVFSVIAAPMAAFADEPVAVEIVGIGPKEAEALRTEIKRNADAANVKLLDASATRAAIQAFLKGSVASAQDPAIHSLRKQMGASHFAVIKQIQQQKSGTVFQVKVYGPDDETQVRVTSVATAALAVQDLATLVAELFPHSVVVPSDDKDDPAPADESTKRTKRTKPSLIPSKIGKQVADKQATPI
jgi:hypothetical protein